MNEKETLKNLHKRFPNLSLDDLFAILDCIVPEYQMVADHNNTIRWKNLDNNDNITYYGRTISEPDFIASCTGNFRGGEIKAN